MTRFPEPFSSPLDAPAGILLGCWLIGPFLMLVCAVAGVCVMVVGW